MLLWWPRMDLVRFLPFISWYWVVCLFVPVFYRSSPCDKSDNMWRSVIPDTLGEMHFGTGLCLLLRASGVSNSVAHIQKLMKSGMVWSLITTLCYWFTNAAPKHILRSCLFSIHSSSLGDLKQLQFLSTIYVMMIPEFASPSRTLSWTPHLKLKCLLKLALPGKIQDAQLNLHFRYTTNNLLA